MNSKQPDKLIGQIVTVDVSAEMKQSYLDYAMSVIIGRALPDVYDGLKPVHRRVLYAMHQIGNNHTKPYKKSASVVGDVLGKYHPHGDSAVYDTIVRLAQPFSMRYLLIDGQGNFGSVDGDSAAAMRYTEIRMEKIAQELLEDIDKETVDFVPNYDGSLVEPVVFPTKLPNLLINGASGIAVGMATNVPPHNLSEVVDGLLVLINNPAVSIDELIKIIPAPDFPTGGILMSMSGVREAYHTGRGKVVIRSKCHIEEEKDRSRIIVSEIPYQVNKARLLEKIAELVRDKKIEGISEIRDESNKQGIRVVIVLQRGERAELLLNNLYTHTALQSSFSFNMVALLDRQPKLLNLKQILEAFLEHRRSIITKRTIFLLRQTRARTHILEGLAVAVAHIDEVVTLIKTSANPTIAKERLMQTAWTTKALSTLLSLQDYPIARPEDLPSNFGVIEKNGKQWYALSETQAQSILELRLQRLTQLEHEKIITEYKECLQSIKTYLELLANPNTLRDCIVSELQEIKKNYGDPRRSEISHETTEINLEDLIKDEERLITLSHKGYCKTQLTEEFRAQRRGGRGKSASAVREEDFIEHLLVGTSLSTLLCFSNFGKVYWIKVHELPEANRIARGKPISNLINLEEGETVRAMLSVADFTSGLSILMVTKKGFIKKVAIDEFAKPRNSGKIAIMLEPGDFLSRVTKLDTKDNDIMIVTSEGRAVRFMGSQVRVMGRSARGVRGVAMESDTAEVVGLENIDITKQIIVVTEQGFGKKLDLEEFKTKNRGGKGVAVIPSEKRKGKLVGVCQVTDNDDIMLITASGMLIRMSVSSVTQFSRSAKGVPLVKLEADDALVALAPIYDAE
ncbi:MAG: DNA gyrase subunit A [Methylacidiphilales bacterium]|nr:DNA gyrase subunit A [Candidatus Methylacidiphilales bacterium]